MPHQGKEGEATHSVTSRSGGTESCGGVELSGAGSGPDPVPPLDKPGQRHAPPVRIRTRQIRRRFDPSWGFETLFGLEEARHDLLEVKFTARMRGTSRDLETALRRLDRKRETDVLRLRERGRGSWHLDTRPDTALFAANGRVDVPAGQGLMVIELTMQLNPTRFLAHQPVKRADAVHFRPARDALRPDPAITEAMKIRTLDGNDNFLETSPDIPAFDQRGPWWTTILRSYLGKIREFFRDHLAPEGSRVQIDRADFGPIRRSELQWEFSHRDAVSWVGAFCNALRVADDATKAGLWRGTEAERNTTGGCLDITKDIRLKVYAKTAYTIRFEVVLSGSSRITQVLRHSKSSPNAEIVDRLQALRAEAVKQIRKTWATIMDVTAQGDATADMFDFMARLNSKVPERNQRLVLSLLGNQRRLTATPAEGVAPDTVCRSLVRAGILIEAGIVTRGPARYALAPAWSAMFDRLLGRSDAAVTLH